MIKLNNEGYYFVSTSGIKYILYEGLTFGAKQRYTSDAIIIMLSDERYTNKVKNDFVGYWLGASFFRECMAEYNDNINDLVTEYEKQNGIYKSIQERILKTLENKIMIDREYMTPEAVEDLEIQIETVKKYCEGV